MNGLARQIFLSFLLILMIITIGTTGYVVLEDWSVLDALYMTAITITTVGYGETHSLSPSGMVFTIALILFSLGVVFYILNRGAKLLIEGRIREMARKA